MDLRWWKSRPSPLINADVVYFVHQKTGAELLYLANDDTNRVFEITLKTPAENDMGVPHVFEHATLGGSEKYPSKELFFNLSYQTYNTYMNASTYSHMTTYPVASLSEDQLYMYADFYTDSCFHPMIHTDESIFLEECWRYSMDTAESDLTIAGTVYSEMQGAYTLASAAYQNWADIMFPGSFVSYSSGGVPNLLRLPRRRSGRSHRPRPGHAGHLAGLLLLPGHYCPEGKALPHASFGCSLTLDTPVPTVVFVADSVNAEDAEIFRATVDAALAQIVTDGLAASAVDAVAAALRLEVILKDFYAGFAFADGAANHERLLFQCLSS